MEYDNPKCFPFSDLMSSEKTPSEPITQPNPAFHAHISHLYFMISNLYQENKQTRQQLQAVKKELDELKTPSNVKHKVKIQYEETTLKKEDEGQEPYKQRKVIDKQYKCQLPFCTRQYGSVTALRAHMRSKHVTNDDNLDFVPL